MNKEINGPVINNAFNSMMRAIAIANNVCVGNTSENGFIVYRNKMHKISVNGGDYVGEYFILKNRNTSDILEMLNFINHYFKIGIEKQTMTMDQINNHKKAIEMIQNEIALRVDFEKESYKILLNNLIKEKEYEIEMLKKKLNTLD
jgi:hypothetical protein